MLPDDQVHPDTHVLTMVNNVIGVVNYVIAARPSLLNFVIADSDIPISPKAFRRHAAPTTVHAAVRGIAQACIPQPDQMLRDLLIGAIGECAPWASRDAGRGTACDRAAWVAACELTGTAAAH